MWHNPNMSLSKVPTPPGTLPASQAETATSRAGIRGSNQYQHHPASALTASQETLDYQKGGLKLTDQARLGSRPQPQPQKPPTIAQLLKIRNDLKRMTAIQMGTLSRAQIEELAQSADIYTLAGVAANEGCSPELLTELAKNQDIVVRMAVCSNRRTPGEALVLILQSSAESSGPADLPGLGGMVRVLAAKAATHPNMPAAVRAMWLLTAGRPTGVGIYNSDEGLIIGVDFGTGK